MSQRQEPRERVSQMVKLYHRGMICPTEMWMQIADALTPATATVVLDSLPQDVKDQLRTVWLERPPAAYINQPDCSGLSEDESRAVCVAVVRWCDASGPPEAIPAEPDGLIRVRVEDGVVRKWRSGEDNRSR